MEELKRAARDVLTGDLRATIESGARYASDDVERMIAQGWFGLLVPESAGGLGLGPLELGVLSHELGRTLTPSPFLGAAVLAASSLDDDALLRRIAAGTPACVSFPDEQIVIDPAPLCVFIGRDESIVTEQAEVVVQNGLDLTRSLGSVAHTDGTPIGPVDAQRVADLGRLALSAESVGAAERALEMSVQYAKDRVQFGKPIGAFQAVQHLLADMLRHVELARAATERAAVALADADPRAHEWCLIAKAKTGAACVEAVGIGIQVHGGIGYTWEHDIHLYYRRVRSNAALLGDPAWCRAGLAEQILS